MIEVPPVLIIAYMRNDNVINLMKTLILAGVSRIYIAIDGPKNPRESSSLPKLSSQLLEIESLEGINLKIWERESNFGPAVSVITAIDWFFSNEPCGIILEDDLKISTDSVLFFADALISFREQKSIGLISGSNYWGEIGNQASLPFANYPLTWGWASWRDRWNDLKKPFYQNSKIELGTLPIKERLFWRTGIEKCMSRKLDAWDIPFAANFRSLNLKAVIPYQNFVTNIGFDEHAGNTFENIWPLNTQIGERRYICGFLEVSFSEDLTQSIIQDIYKVNYRSIFARPFRLLQRSMRFGDSNSLLEAISKVNLPNS